MAANFSPITLVIFFLLLATFSAAHGPHVIKFRSPNLYPNSITWDPHGQHFIVGSSGQPSFHSVTDAGVISTLISDTSLPENSTIHDLAVDSINRRLLATITSDSPPFNALASYDLKTKSLISLTSLPSNPEDIASSVAVDFEGNAYITNSAKNLIWKVNIAGDASVFSRFNERFTISGLSGIHYVSKGYLLVVNSNTGNLFKVDSIDGTVRQVLLHSNLDNVNGIVLRSDGNAVVVSPVNGVYVVKSDDSFGEGRVVEKVAVESEGFPTKAVIGGGGRVYLLYGFVDEGKTGNSERDLFRIEEVEKESDGDLVWVCILVGLALVYFFFWRFQMSKLVTNMDKKIH